MSASIVTISTPLTATRARAASAEVDCEIRALGRPAPMRLRLTRRGRAVVGSLATLFVVGMLAIVAMFSGAQAVAAADVGAAEFGYVVVQPGDSLWQLASDLDPKADPRDLIAEIVRLNQLDSSGLQAGEAIAVPLRYTDRPGIVTASTLGL